MSSAPRVSMTLVPTELLDLLRQYTALDVGDDTVTIHFDAGEPPRPAHKFALLLALTLRGMKGDNP